MAELIWDGKYDEHGKKRAPVRIELPFQTVETVNESVQERQRTLELSSSGNDPEWRNRLIWGDKKYVLPSLLPEFGGKVDLIYIDPPFDTGADFSFNTLVPDSDESFTKEPSMLEQKAYRDTWGQGLESYFKWLSDTLSLLRELLTENGAVYVHLDYHVVHYAKILLDEIFGPDEFVNEIIWRRKTSSAWLSNQFGIVNDTILFYAKGQDHTFHSQYSKEDDNTKNYIKERFIFDDGDGRKYMKSPLINPLPRPNLRYSFHGVQPPPTGWLYSKQRLDDMFAKNELVMPKEKTGRIYRKIYADTYPGQVIQNIWMDIPIVNPMALERLDYPTQKPEALLERIITASSNEGDLVLDCFCGSGTTAAVAEKLNRRWIACDLGRFAIHTTRKRLLGVPDVKPFIVQNLGKYERQQWQVAEFPANGKDRLAEQKEREAAYRKFILELYHATPVSGHVWLHGVKSGRMVHVAAVDAPVTRADVNAIAAEVWKASGKGPNSPQKPAVDVLGWEFALDMNETAKQVAAEARVDATFKKIPREVLEKKAVDQGDVYFFELGALSVDSKVKKREVALTLSDFVIPSDDVPAEVRSAIKHWSQMVDYWAVDWDFKEDTFHNQWQSYRTRKELLEKYAQNIPDLRLPPEDSFARYCTKMATGSGKTKVMALAIAWQYFNARREQDEIAKDYASTFLVIAPNVIVLERLKADFGNGKIFREDPVYPKEFGIFWDFDCVMRGEGERAYSESMLFLTNIQQFYERPERGKDDEPDVMTAILGPRPPTQKMEPSDFGERIAKREGRLLVVNDEAHHTHDEGSEWNAVVGRLHEKTPITAQLDFSATPRFSKTGQIFPWTISDYPLKQAIIDNVVKRPVKGIANLQLGKSDIASVKYRGFLTAAIERWKEYREQLAGLKRKPVLFVMMNDTKDADDVAEWMASAYPAEFGQGRLQTIHTKASGDITNEKELQKARETVKNVDRTDNPINAIVSVLMLREGWDVQNVTVVVGLRPYSAKAEILPEQAIGRGLRLMFRDLNVDYTEHVDIIGTPKFLEFVDQLEKIEDMRFDTVEIGKEKLRILTIMPLEERKAFDIGLPSLSPTLVRKKSLDDEIKGLDVMGFTTILLPLSADDPNTKTFRYDGYDIITLQKKVERDYKVPEPQTAQEVIGYYARLIAKEVKLPSQFAVLAPKVREFFEHKAFGRTVDLDKHETVRAMATPVASYVCTEEFKRVLRQLSIAEQEPQLLEPARMLSSCPPFPWSRKVLEASKSVFNMIPCDNDFEKAFARFLESAEDVGAFAKLPQPFAFSIDYTDGGMNLRSYYPDFVALDSSGQRWLIETKGMESAEVSQKDAAAANWCENATLLTGTPWKYIKIPQKAFEVLQPARFADLAALQERGRQLWPT